MVPKLSVEEGAWMVTTTIKLHDHDMKELQAIAREERRSVGFLIRDAIAFWLAEHRRQIAEIEKQKKGDAQGAEDSRQ
jgi:predicted transcriptional regulator